MDTDKTDTDNGAEEDTPQQSRPSSDTPVEVNGPKGPEPTRYGDWEQKGRCTDF